MTVRGSPQWMTKRTPPTSTPTARLLVATTCRMTPAQRHPAMYASDVGLIPAQDVPKWHDQTEALLDCRMQPSPARQSDMTLALAAALIPEW